MYKMWRKLCFFIFAMCLAEATVSESNDSCYSYSKNTYPYIGINTPYSDIYNNTEETMTLPNCKPVQIWMLGKHGAQYPNKFVIEKVTNHNKELLMSYMKFMSIIAEIHGKMHCSRLYETLAKVSNELWDNDCPKLDWDKGEYLTAQGEEELVLLGERIKAKLPILFENKNKNKIFKFRSTATQSTIASMKSFVKGAFGVNLDAELIINDTSSELPFKFMNIQQEVIMTSSKGALNDTVLKIQVVPTDNDTLLKIYDSCKAWNYVNMNESEESVAFLKDPLTKVSMNFSQKSHNSPLTPDNEKSAVQFFSTIYDLCRIERNLCPNKQISWCDAFTEHEMQVLEYRDDLTSYYKVGPGRKINRHLGSLLFQDMYQHIVTKRMMDEITKLNNDLDVAPSGVFYFVDSNMMSMFLAAIGVGNDSVPLTATNFQNMDRRNWRTSRLLPSAANFAAVLHRCDSSEAPYEVAFYLNEKPLTLKGCENGVCNWKQMSNIWSEIELPYTAEDICSH